MKSELSCIKCFIKQAINVGKLATDDPGKRKEILNRALHILTDFDLNKVPVEFAQEIHSMIKEYNPDPYWKIKRESNLKATELLPMIDELVGESIHKGLKLLAIANIIDFGPFSPTEDLASYIKEKLSADAGYPTEELVSTIRGVDEILYIADNAGEIIFDLHFIKKFLRDKNVYLALRSGPILNDVVVGELENLPPNIEIVDSGSDAPGAFLPFCSDRFKGLFERTPLVISKGQGNYESLNEEKRSNLFFILIAKCPVIANSLGRNVGDLILTGQ